MFWDSSAIVPLILSELRSADLTERLAGDDAVAIWWGTPSECLSAIHGRHRQTPATQATLAGAFDRLRAIVDFADVVAPGDDVQRRAGRLLAVHPLRAADALQLAAALTWCEEQPYGERLVSLDERLRDAARREGFVVQPDN